MNTIRSTWYGWGALAIAGGGAYYFAKRSVNADRKARHEADMKRRRLSDSLEFGSRQSSNHQEDQRRAAARGSSTDPAAGHDSVPSKHPPEKDGLKTREKKSKYEASEPFRAKKGDRFS